ncbi:unnamed protein product [Soboliphyme baturini]|uniref:Uncharacterized protein n=1 Tax=Soboliphyme baturini TaxID=241478 RepID=A0A183ISN5_9BILA|nr:unnamed protein product [Soboliphyme baturini]
MNCSTIVGSTTCQGTSTTALIVACSVLGIVTVVTCCGSAVYNRFRLETLNMQLADMQDEEQNAIGDFNLLLTYAACQSWYKQDVSSLTPEQQAKNRAMLNDPSLESSRNEVYHDVLHFYGFERRQRPKAHKCRKVRRTRWRPRKPVKLTNLFKQRRHRRSPSTGREGTAMQDVVVERIEMVEVPISNQIPQGNLTNMSQKKESTHKSAREEAA